MVNRKNLVSFYLPGFVVALLLGMDYILSLHIDSKLGKMEKRIISDNSEIQQQLARIIREMDSLQEKLLKTDQQQTGRDTSWARQGIPFSLPPDPYFQNLFKGTKPNQALVVGIPDDEKGFNRILENSAQIVEWHDHYINDILALRHWENPNNWAPHLAERVEVSPDNREFKIYLRKDVRWHRPLVDWSNPKYNWLKGEHYVTSDDFYFAYTTTMNPQVTAEHIRSLYDQIESFTIIDDYTFSIRWKKTLYTNQVYTLEQFPLPRFLFSRDEHGREFPATAFAEKFNSHWYNDRMLGCGPYMFAQHQPEEYVEFVRNEDYFGYKPAIKRIRFVVAKDGNVAYQKLKTGEIDVIPQLPEHIYQMYAYSEDYLKKENFVIEVYPRAIYYHIKWNNAHPIFQDKMVRRAMTHAFNRELALEKFLMGLGIVATGDIPQDSNYYNKNIVPYRYDLKLAQKILEEAGWRDDNGDGVREKFINGKKIEFVFTLYYAEKDGDNHRKMYEMYRDALQKIGVQMVLEALDWPTMTKKYENKDFAAIRGAWLTDIPLVDFDQIWHSKYADAPSSSNQVHFKNTEADMICQKMREAIAVEERIRLAHRMQEILHEEQPYTFLFFTKGVAAFNSSVKNRFIRKYRPYILSHPYYVE